MSVFSSSDLAGPRSSVGSAPSPAAAWQLQYHLPVLSQKGLLCLQKGAKRPRALPCLRRFRLSQRRVLQAAGHLWMRFGEFSHYSSIFIIFKAFSVRLSMQNWHSCLLKSSAFSKPFFPPHTCHFVALPTLWRCDRHLSTDKCFSHHHHPWTSFLSVGLCLPWCTRRGRSGFTVRRVTPSHTFLLIDSIESLEQLFKYTYNTWCDSSMNLNVVPPPFFPHSCFPPSGMFPVVASLSTYVRSGIECWSNSGFHTPLITSTSVGGLIIMDSKIFQSPLKNHIPWWRRFFFSFVFFRDFFSFWLMCLPWSKYLETLAVINTNIQRGLFLLQPWFMWSLVYSHA